MAMRNIMKVLVWVTLLIGIILVSLLGVFLLGIRQRRAIRSVNGLCRSDSFLLYQAFFVPMQQVSAVDSAFSVALGNLPPGADETKVADLVNRTVQIADPVVSAVWAPLVRHHERPEFERRFLNGSCIWQRVSVHNATQVCSPVRNIYYPLLHFVGYPAGTRVPRGFDAASRPEIMKGITASKTSFPLTVPVAVAYRELPQSAFPDFKFPSSDELAIYIHSTPEVRARPGATFALADLEGMLRLATPDGAPHVGKLAIERAADQRQIADIGPTQGLTSNPTYIFRNPLPGAIEEWNIVCTPLQSVVDNALSGAEPAVVAIAALLVLLVSGVFWMISIHLTKTEHHQHELEEQYHKVVELDKRHLAFASFVYHEMRNPLQAIRGIVDLVRAGLEASTLQLKHGTTTAQSITIVEAVDTIARSVNSMTVVIDDISELNDLQARPPPIKPVPFDVRAMCTEVVKSYQSIAPPDVALQVHCANTVPVHTLGDANMIRRILSYLVCDALNHCQQGVISLEVTAETYPGEHKGEAALNMRFDVKHSGTPISLETLRTMFDPYPPVSLNLVREYGSSLGLPIVQKLVTLLGGRVFVNIENASFTVITVVLPMGEAGDVKPQDIVALPAMSPRRCLHAAETVTRRPPEEKLEGQPMGRILVAEDNTVNRKLYQRILATAGYQVDTAVDGKDMVEKTLAKLGTPEQYSLLLVDLNMPQLTGDEATMQLRGQGVSIPAVAITANVTPEARERCRLAGMSDFLAKPVSRQTLLDVVSRYVEHVR